MSDNTIINNKNMRARVYNFIVLEKFIEFKKKQGIINYNNNVYLVLKLSHFVFFQ